MDDFPELPNCHRVMSYSVKYSDSPTEASVEQFLEMRSITLKKKLNKQKYQNIYQTESPFKLYHV